MISGCVWPLVLVLSVGLQLVLKRGRDSRNYKRIRDTHNTEVVDRVMAKALINYFPEDGEPEKALSNHDGS